MVSRSAEGADAPSTPSGPVSEAARRGRKEARGLVVGTVGVCFRQRVTGLAAEAAFFALLSLPPLVFGLAGVVGFVAEQLQVGEVDVLKNQVVELASRALTDSTIEEVVRPTVNDVFRGGRYDVISIGFVLALWSGSRALNVFIDTITIMYGLGGRRGVVRTRALSFAMYALGLAVGIVVVPLVLAGPRLVRDVLPGDVGWLGTTYWPIVLLASTAFVTTLYHLSVPVRRSWVLDLPGAVFTVATWLLGSWATREVLATTTGGTSIYGPLSAPIAILLWLYVLSIAVLIGAALNATLDRMHPSRQRERARREGAVALRVRARVQRAVPRPSGRVAGAAGRAAENRVRPDDDPA